jgi:peptidoglycan/LPS O-acetylase OafA/YrhL
MKLREIERLRGVAILMVMVVHWDYLAGFLPRALTNSWSGVDLFFVISGYVVSLSLLRLMPPLEGEPSFAGAFAQALPALRAFYARRFLRILPAVGAIFLVDRVLLAFFPLEFGSADQWWGEVIAFFGGIYNYAYPFAHCRNGSLWSLSVEEHFYIILPILFVALRTTGRRLAGCVAIMLASILARHLGRPEGANEWAWEKFTSHLRFDSLMAGVALALLSTAARVSTAPAAKRPILPVPLMRFFVLPALLYLVAALPWGVPEQVMMREGFILLWLLAAVLVGFAGLDRGYVLSFPVVALVLEFIGSRSYALYLGHSLVIPILGILRRTSAPFDRLLAADGDSYRWRTTVLSLLLAFLIAEALHRLVERPFIRVGRILTDPSRTESLTVPRWALRGGGIVAVLLALVYYRHDLELAVGPRNLALGKAVTASSQAEGRGPPALLTNGLLEPEYGLHTKKEDHPWAVIDLGAPTSIGAIRVYNRADGYQDEPLPMSVSLSVDGKSYVTMAWEDCLFTQSFPWRIRGAGRMARYVRLRVERESTLCLSEVEVFASEAPSHWP